MKSSKKFPNLLLRALFCLKIDKGYEGYNIEMFQEFTVTDDTVLEEHMESPDLVQMRILGEGGVYCSYLQ